MLSILCHKVPSLFKSLPDRIAGFSARFFSASPSVFNNVLNEYKENFEDAEYQFYSATCEIVKAA